MTEKLSGVDLKALRKAYYMIVDQIKILRFKPFFFLFGFQHRTAAKTNKLCVKAFEAFLRGDVINLYGCFTVSPDPRSDVIFRIRL